MLLSDVAASQERHEAHSNQQAKRDLIRTLFAAIEGSAWFYKEHIQALAETTDMIEADEVLALSEVTLTVDKAGKLHSHPRFLTTTASVRLVSRIAHRIAPDHQINFGGGEWSLFQEAIEVRNRLTHPKDLSDLILSEEQTVTCTNAFYWFLEETTHSIEAATRAARSYIDSIEHELSDFKTRNSEAIKAYQQAKRRLDDSD